MIHADTILAEIKNSFRKYQSQGLIDDVSCYKWMMEAVKRFGQNTMEIQEVMLPVVDGKIELPENFYSLYYAVALEADFYCTSGSSKSTDTTLIDSILRKEITEKKTVWNSCNSCCKEVSETTITEKITLDEGVTLDFHYKRVAPLGVDKSKSMSGVAPDCRNKVYKQSPYKVVINGRTMYTGYNFDSGKVYIQYYGIPMSDDNKPMIPESPLGYVHQYVEYHVRYKILEEIFNNDDDTNINNKLQLAMQKEQDFFTKALTDAKMSTINPNTYRRLKRQNRLDTYKYEINFPRI